MSSKFNFQKELTNLLQKQYKQMLSDSIKRGIKAAKEKRAYGNK